MTTKQFKHKIGWMTNKDYPCVSRVKHEDNHVCKVYPAKKFTIFDLFTWLNNIFKEDKDVRIEPLAKFIKVSF